MSDYRDPYRRAEELGADIVLPEDDQLFLDFDGGEDAFERLAKMQTAAENAGFVIVHEKTLPSKTPGHSHVYLRVPGMVLNSMMRIALQACLGSDPMRELWSVLDVLWDAPHPPTLFFEKEQL